MSPMPSKKKLESAVKEKINKLLTKHGWTHWPVAQSMYSQTGVADRHAVKEGVYMAIEAKRDKNHHPTENQKTWLRSIRAQDCFAFVVNDETIRDLEFFLEAYDCSVLAAMKRAEPAEEDKAIMLAAMQAMQKEFM
jgi:penicillin-binding protein-related factor A (putative recombinase)